MKQVFNLLAIGAAVVQGAATVDTMHIAMVKHKAIKHEPFMIILDCLA